MPFPRASGILLHPTSLPSPYGIGDLGPAAYRFVDWLVEAGQKLWQILPLGPTGYGNSPYSARSAFAGNPLLISPERLVELGLLTPDDLRVPDGLNAERVDYDAVIGWKTNLLRSAFQRLDQTDLGARIEAFAADPRVALWLDDYCLFMALREASGGQEWSRWSPKLRGRDERALAEQRAQLSEAVAFQRFCQYLFRSQWTDLRRYANGRGVQIVGDAPIFVAYDSADVWSRREVFELKPDGKPIAVAGVPPDYFCKEGQLWGNPLYNWEYLAEHKYDWWVDRLAGTFDLVDAVRLDHFRGFQAYWRVDAKEKTAIKGQWVEAPGAELFTRLGEAFGPLPIIAEDLGIITDEVEALRLQFGFPGMKILQFAFHPGANFYLPHLYDANTVAYTGTHDNDTSNGWWASCSQHERDKMLAYLGYQPDEMHWALIRLAQSSVANTAICPLQDCVGLGSDGRMNVPGVAKGCWGWRVPEWIDWGFMAWKLRTLAETYDR